MANYNREYIVWSKYKGSYIVHDSLDETRNQYASREYSFANFRRIYDGVAKEFPMTYYHDKTRGT